MLRDAYLVLDLNFHVLDGVGLLEIKSEGLASECLDEDLITEKTTAESEHKVESGLFSDVAVQKKAGVLELLASEDEALLVERNAFLVLDLGLHALDSVRLLDIEGDGLACKSVNEDLHSFYF